MSTTYTNPPRRGAPLALVVLLAMACGTVFMIVRGFNRQETVQKPAPARRSIPLASADLQPGRKIQGSDFYLRQVTADEEEKLTKGRLALMTGQQLVGRLLRTAVKPGQPFFIEGLYPEGTGPTPAELLSEGMRAVTVKITLVGGLRGLAAPSTWVDVLFRRKEAKSPTSTDAARTHTLLSGVRVLAIEDNTYANSLLSTDRRGDMADEFELTLELTPEQSEVLKSVEDRGDLSLNMLPADPDRSNAGTVPSPEVMKLMLGVEDPQPDPVVVAPTVPPTVRVVRGGAQSSVAVDYPTDVIIDQSLYPAPQNNPDDSATSPLPPKPAGDDSPTAPTWPQRAAPGVDQPNSSGGAAPAAAEPAANDAPPGADPAAGDQPQQTSQADESPMFRYPVNSVSRTIIRPGTVSGTMRPILTAQRTSSVPRSSGSSVRSALLHRPLPAAAPVRSVAFAGPQSGSALAPGRSASVRTVPYPRQSAQKNRRQLPLLTSGPQGSADPGGALRTGSFQASPAIGFQRPVVSVPGGPAPAVVGRARTTRTGARSELWSTALMVSSATSPASPRLPLLKSGAQE